MMKKLMNNAVAAAGFAALLLTGACASHQGMGDHTDASDEVAQVRPEQSGQEATVAPAPGPAKVDSDGNVYASSSAPGSGNAASVGTNTNVNIVPQRSSVSVRDNSMTSSTTLTDTSVSTNTTDTTVYTKPVDTTADISTDTTIRETEVDTAPI